MQIADVLDLVHRKRPGHWVAYRHCFDDRRVGWHWCSAPTLPALVAHLAVCQVRHPVILIVAPKAIECVMCSASLVSQDAD